MNRIDASNILAFIGILQFLCILGIGILLNLDSFIIIGVSTTILFVYYVVAFVVRWG